MKSKFYVMLATLLICCSTVANAQRITYPRFHLGVRGGYNINSVSGFSGENYIVNASSGKNFYAGLALDFRITHNPLYVETGFYWMERKYGVDIDTSDILQYSSGFHSTGKDDLFHMPLLLSYHIYVTDDIAIQPFAGGYGGYHSKSEAFGYGIRLGCGVNYKRVYANVGYDIGLNEHKFSTYKIDHINCLFFTLGYNIAGRR